MIATLAAAWVTLLSGGDGDTAWALRAQHRTISGMKGVCIEISQVSSGGGQACLAGTNPIASYGNVLQFGIGSTSGGTPTSNVVAGITIEKARTAVARFEDGTEVTMRARALKAWRRAFGRKVRWFGADVLAKTGATLKVVSVYDAKGRRVGRFKKPKIG